RSVSRSPFKDLRRIREDRLGGTERGCVVLDQPQHATNSPFELPRAAAGLRHVARILAPGQDVCRMRTFESLTEQEVLALAISLEEEDARIYDDFADGLKENHPEQAEKFNQLRRDEDRHRHRLLELYRSRFGDHVPLIRREDVRGFVRRRPVWL